jgi:hypothetical protein
LILEIADQTPEFMFGFERVVPKRPDQEGERVSQSSCKKAEQIEGCLVGPMEIFCDQDVGRFRGPKLSQNQSADLFERGIRLQCGG